VRSILVRTINDSLEKFFGIRLQPSAQKRLEMTRADLLSRNAIELVVDVGANQGQWGTQLRKLGYQGDILSFEPSIEFQILQENTKSDATWKCENLALSNFIGHGEFYSASNANLSSSLLPPQEILNQGFDISFERREVTEVTTLDNYFARREVNSIYLKLDVQGAEMMVLEGAMRVLEKCRAVEFESAITPLYKGERQHYEIARFLMDQGFKPLQLVITHWDKSLRTISLDSIFVR